MRAATSPMNSQPPAPSTSSSRSPTRRAVRARSTSIRRGVNQGMTTRRRSWWSRPSGSEQGARALDGGPVGTGAAHHLEDAGTERGVEQQRVAALVREHPEAARRTHDPRFPSASCAARRADRPRTRRRCGRGTAARSSVPAHGGSVPVDVRSRARQGGLRWPDDGTAASHHLVRRPCHRASGRLRAVHRARLPRAVRRVRPRARRGARERGSRPPRKTVRCSRRRAPTRSRPRPVTRATASGTHRCAPRCSRVRAWSPRCCSRMPAFPSAVSASRRNTNCGPPATAPTTAGCSTSPTTCPAGAPRSRCSPCTISTRPWPRSRGHARTGCAGVIIPTVPGDGLPPYYDQCYDQMWAACQDHEMPVHIHGGSGTPNYGDYGAASMLIYATETVYFAHRPAVVPDLGRRARAPPTHEVGVHGVALPTGYRARSPTSTASTRNGSSATSARR